MEEYHITEQEQSLIRMCLNIEKFREVYRSISSYTDRKVVTNL